MQHPFPALEPEYNALLARMVITRTDEVEFSAQRLLRFVDQGRYAQVSAEDGIPQVWMATSFDREASSNFMCSPAQGDRWDRVSTHVPRDRGPFPNWAAAAKDAYAIDGLDKVGAANWTAARACFEGELFNGFGYRAHGIHSPYLWAGTNNYSTGKYVADGVFDPNHADTQLGIVPVMLRMIALQPSLTFVGAAIVPVVPSPPIVPPAPAPEGVGSHAGRSTRWIQHVLNVLHVAGTPLAEDNSYGRATRRAVVAFQTAHSLQVDGFAGPQTVGALDDALGQA